MIALENLQTHAHGLISSATPFSGEAVIKDEGYAHNDIEAALNSRGFVVVVRPIFDARRTDTAGAAVNRMAVLEARFDVDVGINPVRNQAGDNKSIIREVKHVIRALLDYVPTTPAGIKNQNDNYSLAPDAVTLIADDPGEWSYALTFSKLCVV